MEYSYEVSENTSIEKIDIYLDNVNITDKFTINVDQSNKKFTIKSKGTALYGQHKVLITYGNGIESDTYLNNFIVTHGLINPVFHFNTTLTESEFNVGYAFEYESYVVRIGQTRF